MPEAYSYQFGFLVLRCLITASLLLGCFAYGQGYQGYYPDQEIRISDVPSVAATSRRPSDVLAASVEIVVRDRKVCCGKNSALEDSVQSADPNSLKDVSDKLQGRHLLSDGRPIMVTAEYLPAASVNPGWLLGALREKRALLMEWNSHLYVVYGVIFDQTVDQDGGIQNAIHKILVLDARFSDARRQVTFDRLADNWGKVQGLVMLKAAPQ
jgi:hypothetical protein